MAGIIEHAEGDRFIRPAEGLRERRRTAELLDQIELSPRECQYALQGLKRVNSISRSPQILWTEIERLSSRLGNQPVRVLDLACGGGDLALSLATRAIRTNRNIQIDGCDINPHSVRFAQEQAKQQNLNVHFFEANVLQCDLPEVYDVLTCTLFLHHLSDRDAVTLLKRMSEAATHLVLVDDLIRSRIGYYLAWTGSRLLSRSEVVHHDGPASVAAAWTLEEARQLANRAGLENATFKRHWPERFLMSWSKS